jgi:outer membrane protein assembly factor BamD
MITLLVGTAAACQPRFKPEAYPTPLALFDAAKAAYQRGNCGAAILGFTRVTFEFPPRDPHIAEARYLSGECHFKQGDYLQASQEFRRMADDFPTHELAPSALMRSGDALAKLWKRPELDPTYGEQAQAAYGEALARYPDAPIVPQLRERSAVLTDWFAQKDLKNGDFYYRIKAYDSAMIYYRWVVATYPQSKYAAPALMRLVQTYRRIGYDDEVTETCAHLRQYYPDADGLDRVCPPPAAP